MAAYNDNECLKEINSHPLFGILRENVKNCTNPDESEELMAVRDGDLYVWDKEHLHLLTANLKAFVGPPSSSVDDVETLRYQTLLCTNAPLFDIESVSLNDTNDYVMLYGQKGLALLALPRRYGKNTEFEGGKRTINCRTAMIAERMFVSNPSLKLLEAKWHPSSDTHISILTSDNILRIFDVKVPQRPVQTHYLSEEQSPCLLSSSSTSFQAALGEVAISFVFGPSQKVITRRLGLRVHQSIVVYPIYILKGNGDVYLLMNSLKDKRYVETRLQGPLAMYPPAEDNYGLDACALLCLPSNPPVLVVGTSSGHLHHCLVLTTEEEDEDISSVSSVDSGNLSTHPSGCESSLYVYETIELPMCPVMTDDYDEDDNPHPVRLHQDIGNVLRYYCTHSAGVHSLSLPWAKKLQQFCTQDGAGDGGDVLLALREDQPCRVEHLVCTQPIPTCPPSPILGLAVVADQLLGNSLLCLTSNYECLSLPVPHEDVEPPPDLLSETVLGAVRSPIKRSDTQPFQNNIKRLLKRTSTNPILRSSNKVKLSPNECFMLLGQATKILREEYILKQDLAREAIERRVKILQEQKQQQLNDLKECDDLKEKLGAKAEELADKYENTKEKQEKIVARIGGLLRLLQNRVPVLSDAEQSMRKELKTMEDKLKHVSNSVEQVKLKDNYQRRNMKKDKQQPSHPALNHTQTQKLKSLLKEEGESIASLVNEVKDISMHV